MTLKDTIARLFGGSAATVEDAASPAGVPQTAPAGASEPDGEADEAPGNQSDAGSDAVPTSGSDGDGVDAQAGAVGVLRGGGLVVE